MKPRKLLKKIIAGSRNIRFDDFAQLIIAFGFTLERITGSHHIYSHPGVPQAISAQPDQNNQAKAYQIKQFLRVVEKYELSLGRQDDSADEDE